MRAAWAGLPNHRLAVFVSPNAAEQFFALRPEALAWPMQTLAGSPSPGTSRVLRALGVPAASIVEPAADAAQFDSESLWQQLAHHDWHGARVLVVRGESGRDWLADTLRAHGAEVEFVTAYLRGARPRWTTPRAACCSRRWRSPQPMRGCSAVRSPSAASRVAPHAGAGSVRMRWPPTRASPSARAAGFRPGA